MGCRELALAHAPVMRLEHFQPECLGRPPAWGDAGEAVAEIAVALHTVVFWYFQVQHHQLVSLARVLESTLVGCLDTDCPGWTVQASGAVLWAGPYMDIFRPLDLLDC